MATPKMPLHTPLPAEIKELEVQHFYGRGDYPARPCKVILNGSQITVEKTPNGYDDTVTFCSPSCIQVLDLQKDDFSIHIRHECVDGWKMVFTARDKEVLRALKDAITRARCDQILSDNLLLDDRCRHLHLKTRGHTDEHVQRMRQETTAALPKGTQAEFKASKWVPGHVPVSLAVVNACPAMSFCASKPFFVERLSVEEGVVNCLFGRGMTMEVEAAEFQPPRLVTPPTSEKQIYVCDSRDLWNPRQAWVFTTDRVAAAEFLPVLMHAWMVVDGAAAAPAAKKNEQKKVVETKASAKAKKDAPKKVEKAKAPAKAVASKRGGAAKTASKSSPAPKMLKKVTPKKKTIAKATAPSPKVKKVTAKKVEKADTPAKAAAPKKAAAAKTATNAAPVAKLTKKVTSTKVGKAIAPVKAPAPKRGAATKTAVTAVAAPKTVKKVTHKKVENVETPAKAAAPKRGGAVKKVTKTTSAPKTVKKVPPTKVEKVKNPAKAAAPKSGGTRTSARSAAKAK